MSLGSPTVMTIDTLPLAYTVPTATERNATLFARLSRFAYIALGLQFLAMALWKGFMFFRFSGTMDENEYQQALYLISRGTLDPYNTAFGRYFLQDHGSFLLWLLAPLEWIPPVGLWLLIAAIAFVVASEVVAFRWARHILITAVDKGFPLRIARHWGYVSVVILAASPWMWWAISQDIHGELFAAPFIISAAYNFSRQRMRRGWFYIVITLTMGAITTSWIAGLALSAIVAGIFHRSLRRRLWLTALALVAAAVVFLGAMSAVGLDNGSNLNSLYGYLTVSPGQPGPRKLSFGHLLVFFATHPWRIVTTLASRAKDIYANLAPTGVVGMFAPWTFGVPLVVLIENELTQNYRYAGPIFQSIPIYLFTAVGLSIFAVQLFHRWPRPRLSAVLAVLVCVNTLAWSAVFLPHLKHQWVSVSSAEAATLSSVLSDIPPTSEVIVSQGLISRFSMRRYVYGSSKQYVWPINTPDVWFIEAPGIGIEYSQVHDLKVITDLSRYRYAQLVELRNGIYVFHLVVPPSVTELKLRRSRNVIAGALVPGPAGTAVETGSPSIWPAIGTGHAGYVVARDYWLEPVGHYVAFANVASSAPTNIEVWNANSNTLLAKTTIPPSVAPTTARLYFDLPTLGPPSVAFQGWGPFSVHWNSTLGVTRLELRVWAPSQSISSVYQIGMRSSATAPATP